MRSVATSHRVVTVASAALVMLAPVALFGGVGRETPSTLESVPANPARVVASPMAKLPRMIIEEPASPRGPHRFVASARGVTTVLTALGPSLVIDGTDAEGDRARVRVDLRPVGATNVEPEGRERGGGHVSRFHGRPDEWEVGLPIWRSVAYPRLWPGIDLVVEARGDCIKSTYVVAPGVDAELIRMSVLGADAVRLDADGRLVLATTAGDVVDEAPVAWLEDGTAVGVRYTLARDVTDAVVVGFDVEQYDRTRTLLLDPAVVSQSGFLGGDAQDQVQDLEVDGAGNVYIVGHTKSGPTTFPEAVGPALTPQDAFMNWQDAFVAKINAAGTALVYAGYIGGTDTEYATGIAVDTTGRAYVCGYTASDTVTEAFPAVTGPDLSFDQSFDGWVARVAANGTSLEYCGYIGGNGWEDRAFGIDVDSTFRAYVVGRTNSSDATFPAVVGPDTTKNSMDDAFVSRINPGGTAFEYLGFIGGAGLEDAYDVVAGALGEAWVSGFTSSSEATFPVAVGPSLVHSGNTDAFVAKIASNGASLEWCGYVGGQGSDNARALDVDGDGNVYLAGSTSDGVSFPVLVGPDLTYNGGISDGFVARVRANGQALDWCGFVGGSEWNGVGSVSVDRFGGIWVAGFEQSTESSTVPPPLVNGPDDTHNGISDGYVGRLKADGSAFDFAGYFGGEEYESFVGLALLPADPLEPNKVEAWLATTTESDESTIPVSVGPDLTHNGGEDAIVVLISTVVEDDEPPPDPDPTLTLVAKSGSLKDSAKSGKDKFSYKCTYTFGPESPDGSFDPAADELSFSFGADDARRKLVIPANDPAWKLRPGKYFKWKIKGALVKFNLKKNALQVSLSKFDFPGAQALPIGFGIEFGNDDGADESDWIAKKKAGQFKLVK